MKVDSFRYLVAVQVASVIATIAIGLYEHHVASLQVAAAQAAFHAQLADSWVFKSITLNLSVLSILAFLAVAAWTGLWLLRPWGRVLSLCTTIFFVLGSAVGPPVISLPFENALATSSMLLWGAVLAAAYWSPVSAQFRARH